MLRVHRQFRAWFAADETRHMRSRRRQASRAAGRALWLALLLALALAGRAQHSAPEPPPYQQTAGQQAARSLEQLGNGHSPEEEKQLRMINAERQKSMVSDTNKLLRLARELQDEISRTSPDSLTAAQLHKVAEIEKLARSVKEKMSSSVQRMPGFSPSFSPQFH